MSEVQGSNVVSSAPAGFFKEGRTLTYDAIHSQTNFLMGDVLTVVDAVFSEGEQRKAVKDLMRARFHDRLMWIRELCYGSPSETDVSGIVLDGGQPPALRSVPL